MRAPFAVLLLQLVLGIGFVVFVLLGGLPGGDAGDANGTTAPAAARKAPNRFDGVAAFELLRLQVRLGERPAGSRASRRLAARLRRDLDGRYQPVPGGLRNVVVTVPGRERGRVVVVGAHYDTKDIDGFVGANDGASGTAVVWQLARTIEPRTIGPTLKFVFFDGEEAPAGVPDSRFEEAGLRGSKVAARAYRDAEAMILLDFVGDRDLSIPREGDPALWRLLRAAARRAGALRYFPDAVGPGVIDDHTPFQRRGVPAIDLIDFAFPCWHRTCDDLSAVSRTSVDAVGETMVELLRRL